MSTTAQDILSPVDGCECLECHMARNMSESMECEVTLRVTGPNPLFGIPKLQPVYDRMAQDLVKYNDAQGIQGPQDAADLLADTVAGIVARPKGAL